MFLYAAILALSASSSGALAADSAAATANKAYYGKSLFEEFISANGGEIPYPPGELRKKMTEYFKKGDGFGQVEDPITVARGRSLQAGCTSDLEPRVLTADETDRGPVFMGFSEGCGAMEVITWNPKEGEYNFLFVENYGPGKKPQLRHAFRNECADCHQNGAPVFSRFPWRESDNPHALGALFEKMDKKGYGKKYLGFDFSGLRARLKKDVKFTPGQALDCKKVDCQPRSNPLGPISQYDMMVRVGNLRKQKRNMCNALCAKSSDCLSFAARAEFLKMPPQLSAAESELKSELEKNWPKDGFAMAGSSILDREPTNAANPSGMSSAPFAAYFPPDQISDKSAIALSATQISNPSEKEQSYLVKHSLANTARTGEREVLLPEDSAQLSEPTYPRDPDHSFTPWDALAAIQAGECMDTQKEIRDEVRKLDQQKLQELLKDKAFLQEISGGSKMISGDDLGLKILARLQPNDVAVYCSWNGRLATELPAPGLIKQAQGVVDAVALKPHAEELFLRHCAVCHHAGSIWPPHLPLRDLDQMAHYTAKGMFAGYTPLKLLKEEVMPHRTQVNKPITEEERKIMIEALESRLKN